MRKLKECPEYTPVASGLNTIPTVQDSQGILLSPSLFIRLLEWAKEDAGSDVCLHQLFEKLMNLNTGSVIGMDMYDYLLQGVSCEEEQEDDSVADSSDIENAMELGFNQAIKADAEGEELSRDGGDYSHTAGELIADYKDDGYGASNEEIDAFWQGADNAECTDCQIFDDDETDGLEALSKYRQQFSIEEPKPAPQVDLTISSNEDEEIEKIINLAKFM